MSENMREENENMTEENTALPADDTATQSSAVSDDLRREGPRLDAIRSANKTKIKELAALLDLAANNPRVTDEQLEQIVGSLRMVDPHALDTAADGCGR